MPGPPLRTVILGCGWGGRLQMERGFGRLPDAFEVVACCDQDAARAAGFAAQHGIPRWHGRIEDALQEPGLEVVSICTPPAQHAPMVLAAIEAGKHVICEKPFTSSLRLMDSVIARQAACHTLVMPIFQYRFGPGIAGIKHVIESGLAGRTYVASVETAWQRGPEYYQVSWRGRFATELGGVLLTQAIHIHDLFLWLLGPVSGVAAFKATRVNPIEVEDCAAAALEMADGSLATLTATLGSARPLTRIRLCFEHATFECQAFDAHAADPGGAPWQIIPRGAAMDQALRAKAAEARPAVHAGYARQLELFHAAVTQGAPLPVTLQDARRSLELVTALFHAAETGQAARLPLGRDHPFYDGWRPPAAS